MATENAADPAVADATEETAPETVESQIAVMEQRLAEGKPILEEEPEKDAVQERGAEEVDVGEQAGDGEEVGGGDEEDEGGEPAEEPGEGEGDEEGEGEGEELEASEGEDEEDVDVFEFGIPGRRPGENDETVEFEGLTQAQREGLNRLRNGYMRGEDARRQLEEVQELKREVDTVARHMDLNPVGYINEALDTDQKAELVKFLLTQDEIFQAIYPELEDWDADPKLREGEAAKIERDILKNSQKAEREAAVTQAAREKGDMIVRHLEELGENLDERQLGRYMRFALQDLDDYVKENPKTELELETVHRVLKRTGVFESFGIKPILPKAQRPTSRTSTRERLEEARSRVSEARTTSDKFKKKRARKRAAGTSPPGSGPGPVRTPFKKGQTVEERIAYIEKHGLPKS